MSKYTVEIVETYAHYIVVEADSEEAAIIRANRLYRNADIVLDDGDFVDFDIDYAELSTEEEIRRFENF